MTLRYYNQFRTVLEWFTVWKILLLFLGWILLFGVIDWTVSELSDNSYLADDHKHDKSFPASLYNALYFSTITATTLGYGDVLPSGWLRLSASIEVLGGLLVGGLLVSTIASAPLRLTRLALRECAGTWIERSQFTTGNRSVVYGYTIITVNGNSLTILGETFDSDPKTHGTTYNAILIANQFPTLIFTYDSDAAMEDYTSGIYKIEMRAGSSGIANEFFGECYDAKHGRRDRVHSYKVTNTDSLRKLQDPRTRKEELRKLILYYYQEQASF